MLLKIKRYRTGLTQRVSMKDGSSGLWATGVTKYLYIVITIMKYKGTKVTGAKNRSVSSNPRHKVSFSGHGDRD